MRISLRLRVCFAFFVIFFSFVLFPSAGVLARVDQNSTLPRRDAEASLTTIQQSTGARSHQTDHTYSARPAGTANITGPASLPQGTFALSPVNSPIIGPACTPSCGKGNLTYHSGSVQTQPKAYLIFWGPGWKTKTGIVKAGQVVENYFSDVGGTSYEAILTQYYMQNPDGSQSYIQNTLQYDSSHVWIDPSTPPSDLSCFKVKTIRDTAQHPDIKTEITNATTKNHWPTNDINVTYFVYTPSGYAVNNGNCSNDTNLKLAFCGYHSAYTGGVYAEMVYTVKGCQVANSPNNNIVGDSLVNTSAHEQFEAATDPIPGLKSGNSPDDGWYDSTGHIGEVGDKCNFNIPGTTKLNNNGVFEVQEMYSDNTGSGACANTFVPHLTVNVTADTVPPCTIAAYSLRCAINQVNSDGSGKPIWFNIPSTDTGCQLTNVNGTNVFVCTISATSGFPGLYASNIIIDGYTQPGAQKNTLPLGSGDNAILTIRIDGAKGGGLVIGGVGNVTNDTLQGLEVTDMNPYGILVYTTGATNNTIKGNFVGTDGTNALGSGTGIYIASGSSNNTIGGETPDSVNLISGNSGQGITVGAGSGNTIEGNYIGTDHTGTAALRKATKSLIPNPFSSNGLPNGTGIAVFASSTNTLIGGTIPAAANIIAHNSYGITSEGGNTTSIIGNTISSNYIGVVVDNGETGDSISENTINNNTDAGIQIGNSTSDSSHAYILANRTFSNGGLGIDLYPLDTVNCAGPVSGAPNDYTPCPVITSATTTQVSGTACASCHIEVYIATNEPDDQGYGEGQTFINSATADGSGNWSVSATLSNGTQITATATTPASPGPEETSEFAANVPVSSQTLSWKIVSSSDSGTGFNSLPAVAVVSANNVWAAGYSIAGGTSSQALIEHWNGSSWSIVASPSINNSSFAGIAAVSANDIWAVGYYIDGNGNDLTLIEHWDGTSWSMIPSPNAGATINSLLRVQAIATNNVWTVGDFRNSNFIFQTLIEHWDGSSWAVVSSPNVGTNNNELESIAGGSANDIWAVGNYNDGSGNLQALIEHWNGTGWSVVNSSQPGSYAQLSGVTVVSSNDAWAVGSYAPANSPIISLIEHWNGTSWSVATSPNPPNLEVSLNGVAAVSSTDVWAVGNYFDTNDNDQTLIEHWDGTSWSVVTSPNPGPDFNQLYGIAVVSSNDIWAVGTNNLTLIEHYS